MKNQMIPVKFNDATIRVRALAEALAVEYSARSEVKGVLHVGSGAEGKCDYYSDLDISVYYEEMPSEEQLAESREALRATERNWTLGAISEGWYEESCEVGGIECQVGHTLISTWEDQLDEALVRHNPITRFTRRLTAF